MTKHACKPLCITVRPPFSQKSHLNSCVTLSLWGRREKLLILQKATLGIADIFEQEGLQLSEQDVRKEMDDAARDFQENDQEYDEGRLLEQVEEVLKVTHTPRCQCMLLG